MATKARNVIPDSDKQRLLHSGIAMTWDPQPWNLQIDYRWNVAKEYAPHIIECLKSLIEARALSGVDYNGKPFARYAEHKVHFDAEQYTYRNRAQGMKKGKVYQRTRLYAPRMSTRKNTTGGTKWGFKYKKPGDPVTLHGKNKPNEGAWQWDYDITRTDGQWRASEHVGEWDGYFAFYPYIFRRAERVKRRRHRKYSQKTPEALKATRIALVDDTDNPGEYKRKANNKTRNHPLWVLHFGRATESQAWRLGLRIKAEQNKLATLYEYMDRPWIGKIFGNDDREYLEDAQARYKAQTSYDGEKALTKAQAKSLASAIERAKKNAEEIYSSIQKKEKLIESLELRKQSIEGQKLKVPDRRWFGYTDSDAQLIQNIIESFFRGTWNSYEEWVFKKAEANNKANVGRLHLYDANGKPTFKDSTLQIAEGNLRLVEQRIGMYLKESDYAWDKFLQALEIRGGSCYLGVTPRGKKYSDSELQMPIVRTWKRSMYEQKQELAKLRGSL